MTGRFLKLRAYLRRVFGITFRNYARNFGKLCLMLGANNKQNDRELFCYLLFLTNKFLYTLGYIIKRTYICHTERDEKRAALVGLGNSSN